jgi:ABC-type dipeptide/oligopeptide/nickel transport system permease component
MVRFILRRVVLAALQLLVAAVGIFFLLHIVPADPVSRIVGLNPSRAAVHQAMASLGLNRSIWAQLWSYLSGLPRGNFGTSWVTSQPVGSEMLGKFPVTLQFVVPAFVIAIVVGIPIGLLVATRPNGKLDRVVTGYSLFAGAQPDFWWGLMFLFLFNFVLHIFPAPLGILSPIVTAPPSVTNFVLIDSLIAGDWTAFFSAAAHLALPVLTLAFVLSGPIIKMTRQNAQAVFESEYVLYAKASGLPRAAIRRRTLSVAIAPVFTLTGILFGFMLGGAVLIENVFSLNGLGTYALQRTLDLDFPAIQGSVILLTSFALLVYVVMDVLHALVDPRVALS